MPMHWVSCSTVQCKVREQVCLFEGRVEPSTASVAGCSLLQPPAIIDSSGLDLTALARIACSPRAAMLFWASLLFLGLHCEKELAGQPPLQFSPPGTQQRLPARHLTGLLSTRILGPEVVTRHAFPCVQYTRFLSDPCNQSCQPLPCAVTQECPTAASRRLPPTAACCLMAFQPAGCSGQHIFAGTGHNTPSA